MKRAVIACQVFYQEIKQILSEQDVRILLLPQGLHNKPDSADMRREIQKKIDFLETEAEYDQITLVYGLCSGGIEGLRARRAALVLPVVHDCIPLLLGEGEIKGNTGSGRSYYLSRGWIDCGDDSYRQHLFMVDRMQGLIDRFKDFKNKHSEAMVDWYQSDHYQKAERKVFAENVAEYVTFECLKNYRALVLIDNQNLANIHLDYAQKMYGFIKELLDKNGQKPFSFRTVRGDLTLLKNLLFFEQGPGSNEKNILYTPPGEGVALEKVLRS